MPTKQEVVPRAREMDVSWCSSRKPYPMPTLENDESFTGTRVRRARHEEPLHLAQSQEPWQRLHDSDTFTSSHRKPGEQVSRDSLDFILQSLYDHHSGFLKGRNEIVVQKDTLNHVDGWALKNCVEETPNISDPHSLPLRRFTVPKKETIHNIAGAIQSHHSAATNRGFSRKQDGGFYCT